MTNLVYNKILFIIQSHTKHNLVCNTCLDNISIYSIWRDQHPQIQLLQYRTTRQFDKMTLTLFTKYNNQYMVCQQTLRYRKVPGFHYHDQPFFLLLAPYRFGFRSIFFVLILSFYFHFHMVYTSELKIHLFEKQFC